jgi:cell division protein FtsW
MTMWGAKAQKNHIDLITLIVTLFLMVMSVGIVYSASSTYAMQRWGESGKLLGNHAAKVVLGFLVMFVAIQVDYHFWKKISKGLLIGVVVALVITRILGGELNGAARWLRIGGFGFQPSEFARFALITHLAVLLSFRGDRVRDLKSGYVPLLIWTVLVAGLVLVQPAFSTGSMIFLVSILMLFLGGVRLTHLGLTLSGLIPMLILYMVSAEYRMHRVMDFIRGLFSESGITRINHQVYQGLIGFANGGLIGMGPGNSKQRELFLPESYGDFIYSIIGEEYGLIGALVVLGLFLVIMLRGLKIANHARDDFGRYLALGITCSIVLYAVVNAGVTLGILPTTGLPMPFISYGGSSMLVSSMMIGVLLNISAQTDLYPRQAAGADGTVPLKPQHTPAVGKVY